MQVIHIGSWGTSFSDLKALDKKIEMKNKMKKKLIFQFQRFAKAEYKPEAMESERGELIICEPTKKKTLWK